MARHPLDAARNQLRDHPRRPISQHPQRARTHQGQCGAEDLHTHIHLPPPQRGDERGRAVEGHHLRIDGCTAFEQLCREVLGAAGVDAANVELARMGTRMRQQLGIAVVGGLVVSQVLTLYLTPVIYLYMDKLQQRFGGKRKASESLPVP